MPRSTFGPFAAARAVVASTRIGLGVRLFLLPLVVALPMLVLQWRNADEAEREAHRSKAQEMARIAAAAAAAQDTSVEAVGSFLRVVSQLGSYHQGDTATCNADLAEAVQAKRVVRSLALLDAEGYVHCNSLGLLPSSSLIEWPVIAGAMRHDAPFLAEPSSNPQGGVNVFMALALRDPPELGSTLRGFSFGSVDPGHLPAMAAGGLGPVHGSRRLYVLDQSGRVLEQLPAEVPGPGASLLAAMLGREAGSAEVEDANGARLLLGFARSERLGLRIGIATPLEPLALATASAKREALILAGFVLLSAFVASAWLGAWLVRRPVSNLVAATEAIAQGQYGAAERIGRLPGELDRARLALRAMGRTLEARADEAETSRRMLAIEASTDALTGLANRRAFTRRLADACALAQRTGGSIALLVVDVDYFKRYNDLLGHQQGDECLRALARLLEGVVREDDLAARLGGEEFVVLLSGSAEVAIQVAARLRLSLLDAAIPHPGSPLGRLSVSIGIAAGTTDQFASPDSLLGKADAALYAAKRAGRDRWEPGWPDAVERADSLA